MSEDIIIEVPTEVITIEMTPEGKDGQDGFSPIAAVSKSGKTATITITDKTGTTTASVTDGEDGQPGPPGTTTWEGITDKPESFPPSAHTHTVTDITDFPTLGTMSAESASDYYTKSATDALLSEKASIIRTTASGSLVHLTDAAAMPVDALTVGIEPVQDLHGQSAPYPAGGGKNILPGKNLSQTVNTIACSFTTDDVLTISGTNSSANNAYFNIYTNASERVPISAGTYTFSSKTTLPSGLNITLVFKDSGGSDITSIALTPSQQSKNATIAVDCEYIVYCTIIGSATISYNGGLQLEKGSSATSWSPYSNVCPISGHSTATVTRTGKNLCEGITNDLISINSTEASVVSGTGTCLICHLVKGQTYTFSNTDLNRRVVSYWDSLPSVGSTTPYFQNLENTTFTAIKSGLALIYIYNSAVATNNAQIELSSTVTTYEPYQGQIVTIDLNGTRYGGTVDVRTGVMTVDRTMVLVKDVSGGWNKAGGGSTWIYSGQTSVALPYKFPSTNSQMLKISASMLPVCAFNSFGSYARAFAQSTSNLLIKDTDLGTVEEFLEVYGNMQLVLELATPLTVQLTPAELSLLYGTNNVWADSGDVNVGYRADTKLYIDRKIAELQALILDN